MAWIAGTLSIEGVNLMSVAHLNSLHEQLSYCTNLYMVMKYMGFTLQQIWVIGYQGVIGYGFKFPAY